MKKALAILIMLLLGMTFAVGISKDEQCKRQCDSEYIEGHEDCKQDYKNDLKSCGRDSSCRKASYYKLIACNKENRQEREFCRANCDGYIDKNECKKLGGMWNECASPCFSRSCIALCMPTCEFP